MELVIYENKSDHNIINKELIELKRLDIQFNNEANVLSPSFRLSAEVVPDRANYLYVPKLNRYYYIDSLVRVNNSSIVLGCTVDVLETYTDGILKSEGNISRRGNNFNEYYDGGDYPSETRKEIETHESDKTIPQKENIILVTIAGGKK